MKYPFMEKYDNQALANTCLEAIEQLVEQGHVLEEIEALLAQKLSSEGTSESGGSYYALMDSILNDLKEHQFKTAPKEPTVEDITSEFLKDLGGLKGKAGGEWETPHGFGFGGFGSVLGGGFSGGSGESSSGESQKEKVEPQNPLDELTGVFTQIFSNFGSKEFGNFTIETTTKSPLTDMLGKFEEIFGGEDSFKSEPKKETIKPEEPIEVDFNTTLREFLSEFKTDSQGRVSCNGVLSQLSQLEGEEEIEGVTITKKVKPISANPNSDSHLVILEEVKLDAQGITNRQLSVTFKVFHTIRLKTLTVNSIPVLYLDIDSIKSELDGEPIYAIGDVPYEEVLKGANELEKFLLTSSKGLLNEVLAQTLIARYLGV